MIWDKDFEAIAAAVCGWANGKGIARRESATNQMGKMIEEVMELDKEVGLNDIEGIKDELGDVLVTCIVQAECHGLDPVECLQAAYDKISKRKGETVNGVFIKEMPIEHDFG
tara:strand:+ start:295 stop:630 length:336 start_codon:yes stop_codon:yes gene_type:complete